MRSPLLVLLALATPLAAGCDRAPTRSPPSKSVYDHALILGTFRIHQTTVLPIEGFSGINPCTGEETAIAARRCTARSPTTT